MDHLSSSRFAIPADHRASGRGYTPEMNEDSGAIRKSTSLYWSERFLGHETGDHPEHPGRAAAIVAELRRQGLFSDRPETVIVPADDAALRRVHDPAYLERLAGFGASGGGWIDDDTLLAPDSLEVARWSAGAAVTAVRDVLAGHSARAFSLGRPPGHHATRDRAMGFCLYNNAAIAAAEAQAAGLERVAIIDWDVHHGNGTQDIFYDTDRVFFLSMHQHPYYPGTGWASEKGDGAGRGYTVNAPLPAGQGDRLYLRIMDELFLPLLRAYRPELVIVSAGFDAHFDDPLAAMHVTEAGFATMAAQLADLADETADGRLVAVLEGGYDPGALGRSVAAVIRALDGEDMDAIAAGGRQEGSVQA
jgi:acetoin utilization deacetylase AcuC-like enzyme